MEKRVTSGERRIENRRFLVDSHGRSCHLMNKWRVSLEVVERGENRRQPRPGWKKEEQKEKSRGLSPADCCATH